MLTHPFGSNSGIFEFENILMAEDPSDRNLKRVSTLKMGKLSDIFFFFRIWSKSNL